MDRNNSEIRYARNLQLPDFDTGTQRKLSAAGIFITGAGALGSVAAMYLAGSGVGRIGVADYDTIDLSNLQRQVFYKEAEVGKSKARTLAAALKALDSGICVDVIEKFVTPAVAEQVFAGYDVILECSDNPATKNMVVSAGKKLGIPVVVGGVREYSGQVAVFTGDSPDYTDIFPDAGCSSVLPCGAAGVFGPVPGMVACMQAAEAIKIITGIGSPLESVLLTFDVRTMEFRKFRL